LNVVEAIILGLVEGLTEYLPVSSTGHLILAEAMLDGGRDAADDAAAAFIVVIQGGAIAAIAGLYWPRIVSMARGLFGRDPAGRRLLVNLVVAFAPAAILGPLLSETIEDHLFSPLPVLAALAVGGIVMILIPTRDRPGFEIDQLGWKTALVIGLVQCLAMWPGTSRSMVTIVGGTLVGLRPRAAAEFSFLLGLPTLGGACLYTLLESMLSPEENMFAALGWLPVIAGFAVATISAMLAVKWMVGYLSHHGLALFGWYRLGLCVVMAVLAWWGVVEIGE
jgi:undecaprenyl-diphosphatase